MFYYLLKPSEGILTDSILSYFPNTYTRTGCHTVNAHKILNHRIFPLPSIYGLTYVLPFHPNICPAIRYLRFFNSKNMYIKFETPSSTQLFKEIATKEAIHTMLTHQFKKIVQIGLTRRQNANY